MSRRTHLLFAALVFSLALGIRSCRAQYEGLWGDEVLQVKLSLSHRSSGVVDWIRNPPGSLQLQMPLSYLLIDAMNGPASWSVARLRLPSCVAGSLLCCVPLLVATRRRGVLGLLLASALALSPDFSSVAAQARPYAISQWVGACLFWVWMSDGLQWGRARAVVLAGLAFLGISNSYLALVFAAGLLLADGVLVLRGLQSWARARSHLLAIGSAALVCSPILYFVATSAEHSGYVEKVDWASRALDALQRLPGTLVTGFWDEAPVVVALLVAVSICIAAKGKEEAQRRQALRAGLGISLSMLATAVFLALAGHDKARYFAFPFGGLVVVATWCLAQFARTELIAGILLIASAASFAQRVGEPSYPSWQQAALFIDALPEHHAVRLEPQWLSDTLHLSEMASRVPRRDLQPQDASHEWVFSDIEPEASEPMFRPPESEGWRLAYDRHRVMGWVRERPLDER